jgi:NADH:ubiquinone oxidoreductase subunit 2 (subunit N)
VRAAILAAGLCATALIVAVEATYLFPLALYADRRVIGTLLTAAAIASPLFGTIAGLHQKHWNPLLAGCAIGLFLLIALFAVL